MSLRVAWRSTPRIVLALIIVSALLPTSSVSLLLNTFAQGHNQSGGRTVRAMPGKPQGSFPNLDDIQREKHEAPPPIPSTIRSQRNSGKPWDGRRVGDPWPQEKSGQANRTEGGSASSLIARRHQQTRRAHAFRRVSALPPIYDDQFIQNSFAWALARSPFSNESTYWYDQLRLAYGQSQESLKLAAIEFGRTLFESAEYAARNRDNHLYVYDLYKAYLMRDPDAGGWANWEAIVATIRLVDLLMRQPEA